MSSATVIDVAAADAGTGEAVACDARGSWFSADPAKRAIYVQLRDWILYTRLAPGQKLNERELSARFGISRTPMREILQCLAGQELLTIQPRQGVFVAEIEPEAILQTFEVRLPLEVAVAGLAAQRAGQEDVARLRALAAELELAAEGGDMDRVVRLDAQFHDALALAARNPVLRRTREALHNVCLRYWHLLLSEGDSRLTSGTSEHAHSGLAAAVAQGDVGLARTRQQAHVMGFLDILEK